MPEPATPAVLSAGIDSWGEWATVRVAGGTTVTELTARSEHLAAYLAVDSVRVTRDAATVAVAHIRALRSDPLNATPAPWPWTDAAWTSLWWPVPVGVDDNGQTAYVTLVEHNLLVGGEPGSGKSVAVSQLVAAAALDPTVSLYLLDGKLVELASWVQVADGFAGTDIDDATILLRSIQTRMDSRYTWLLEHGRRKVPRGSELIVVVIDELAHYLTWPDKKPRDAFSDTLRDIVSRGRAAGVIVIAATQKPSSDVIPTSLRDLFGYRWALRATTPAASDTILGNGWATNGYTSSTISPSIRGGGYLLHEAGLPIRLRAHHLTDHTITTLAARALNVRRQYQPQPAAGDGREES
jgi:DNA segregation ATPase FtsK/SpoIIIE-like protein